MKFTIATILALATAVSCDFTCIKPVNPIPAGPPGACCQKLDQSFLLPFLYTGKTCTKSTLLATADDGKTTYTDCPSGQKQACCDPLLMKLSEAVNPACVLPVS